MKYALLIALFSLNAVAVQVEVNVDRELARLLKEVDADGDKRITILDMHNKNSQHTSSRFILKTRIDEGLEVEGVYFLSNLLQELKLAQEQRRSRIDGQFIFEPPVGRISRLIRELYWDNLTRQVDGSHLEAMLSDGKVPPTLPRVVYVPERDDMAFRYFSQVEKEKPELKFVVRRLAGREIPEHNGLLTLGLNVSPTGQISGVPFVVPGGRFNEMYGWDSYFEALGLINDGRVDLAKAMVDNCVYEIENYGQILNANRSYYLNRSQPPFLTSMILAVFEKISAEPKAKEWLKHSMQTAMTEYWRVWMNSAHLTDTGLSRYRGTPGHGVPPEVEIGHFDDVFKVEARRRKLTLQQVKRRYQDGSLNSDYLDDFFMQDLAVRESGHDTTSRWRWEGQDRAADFVTVDLNSLLYKYELDFAKILHEHFHDEMTLATGERTRSEEWRERAEKRKALLLKYLWNPEARVFYDYNFRAKKQSKVVSATAFYPFWAADPDRPETQIVSADYAAKSFRNILSELEAPGGILSLSRSAWLKIGAKERPRQWDYPNGWAPHQMIAWTALRNYHQDALANRLIYKWLYMITRNAVDFNGTIPEKFDVMKRSHAVFAEYGNVGTSFAYITKEGFGWMNASYQVGLAQLPLTLRSELDRLRPPEWLDSIQNSH